MNEKRIENLTQRIRTFVKLGGDIYADTKSLPYYDTMRYAKKEIEAETGEKVSMEYMYSLCGIKFDRDYRAFQLLQADVSKYADEHNCVDVIRTTVLREQDGVYDRLKTMANKYGVSTFDFLTFMTPYHFSSGRVHGDSISRLKEDLLDAYPTRNLEGIRWDRPDLYERMRSLNKSLPESLSMQDLAGFLGFYNEKFSATKPEVRIDENELLGNLAENFPDKDVSGITSISPSDYQKIVRLSFKSDQTPQQWLEDRGYQFPTAIDMPRLSTTKVGLDDRLAEITDLRNQYIQEYDTANADNIDMFHINIQVMQRVVGELEERRLPLIEGLEFDTPAE